MGIIIAFPAGGAVLRVKAYPAASALPGSERAGAVAVITNAALRKVYASEEAPASPETGDVWVWLGSGSRGGIALGQRILLPPRAVYVCYSGSWVRKEAYVYTTAWTPITLSLYDNGAFLLASDVELITGDTIGKQSTRIYAADQAGRGETSRMRVYFANGIDLTNASIVKMMLDWTVEYSDSRAFVRLEIGSDKTGTVAAYALTHTTGSNLTLSVNAAALSGLYYIGVYAEAPANADNAYPRNTVYIQKTWLEK